MEVIPGVTASLGTKRSTWHLQVDTIKMEAEQGRRSWTRRRKKLRQRSRSAWTVCNEWATWLICIVQLSEDPPARALSAESLMKVKT